MTLVLLGSGIGVLAIIIAVLAVREPPKRALPRIDPAAVRGLEIVGRSRARLARVDDGWRVWDPEQVGAKYRADTGRVEALLRGLSLLADARFITDDVSERSRYGVDADGVRLSVETAAQNIGLVVGSPVDGGTAVRLADGDDVFVTPGPLAPLLPRTVDDCRPRRLFDVRADDVQRIAVRREDGQVLTLHSGEDGWRVETGLPEGASTNTEAAHALAERVLGLEVVEYAPGDVTDAELGEAGFSTISVQRLDGSLVSLNLGAPMSERDQLVARTLAGQFERVDADQDGRLSQEELALVAAEATAEHALRETARPLADDSNQFVRFDRGLLARRPADGRIERADLDAAVRTARLALVRVEREPGGYLVSAEDVAALRVTGGALAMRDAGTR